MSKRIDNPDYSKKGRRIDNSSPKQFNNPVTKANGRNIDKIAKPLLRIILGFILAITYWSLLIIIAILSQNQFVILVFLNLPFITYLAIHSYLRKYFQKRYERLNATSFNPTSSRIDKFYHYLSTSSTKSYDFGWAGLYPGAQLHPNDFEKLHGDGYLYIFGSRVMTAGQIHTITAYICPCRFEEPLPDDGELLFASPIPTSQDMMVRLSSFLLELKLQSSELQSIFSKEPTKWIWEVKPEKQMDTKFMVHVTSRFTIDSRQFIKDIEIFQFSVFVRTTLFYQIKSFVLKNYQWLIGLITGTGLFFSVFKALGAIK